MAADSSSQDSAMSSSKDRNSASASQTQKLLRKRHDVPPQNTLRVAKVSANFSLGKDAWRVDESPVRAARSSDSVSSGYHSYQSSRGSERTTSTSRSGAHSARKPQHMTSSRPKTSHNCKVQDRDSFVPLMLLPAVRPSGQQNDFAQFVKSLRHQAAVPLHTGFPLALKADGLRFLSADEAVTDATKTRYGFESLASTPYRFSFRQNSVTSVTSSGSSNVFDIDDVAPPAPIAELDEHNAEYLDTFATDSSTSAHLQHLRDSYLAKKRRRERRRSKQLASAGDNDDKVCPICEAASKRHNAKEAELRALFPDLEVSSERVSPTSR